MRQTAVSNEDFGQAIGVSASMASRIRNGQRLPGTQTLHRIHAQLDIPLEVLMLTHARGPKPFGRLIRSNIQRLA